MEKEKIWTDIIKDRIEEYKEKTKTISDCLEELIGEAKVAGFKARKDFVATELKWDIEIADVKNSISYEEIVKAQRIPIHDEHGNRNEVEIVDFKKTLTMIVLDKIKWLSDQK